MHRTAILLVCSLLCGSSLSANVSATGQQSEQKLSIGIAEVTVDVVVRDKQGRPVKGLTASDFEVYEEGALQQITSSRMVAVEPQTAAMKPATPGVTASPGSTIINATGSLDAPRVTAVAFIFDRMAPDSRARARDAALSYVGENMKLDCLAGVYVTDLSLEVLQPLTRDAQLVRTALDRAATRVSTPHTTNTGEIRALRDDVAVRVQSNNAQDIPVDPFGGAAAESQLRMMESFEALQQEQLGMGTINALTAAIDSLRGIAGRKAVIFFSDGLEIPPVVEPLLRSIIGTSSRSHVSVYAVDAAGLRAQSAQAEVSKEIQSRSNARMAQLGDNQDPSGPMTKGLERNETILRSDPRNGLGQLSSQTGGFLISDTNDLKTGMKRIDEDLRTFYLLTYAPKEQLVDGRFRRIEVKVKRGGLSVQNRRGYYAIKASYASPVMEYETPALGIAESGRRPQDVKVGSSVVSFPEASHAGLVAALAEVPMSFVKFQGDEQTKKFATDFSIVMLFKSETNEVVKKLSHRYALDGPLANLEGTRKESVLFYRQVELDPGRYRVQTITYDALGKKAGAREDTLEVPASGDKDVRLSSIVLIRRAERLKPAELKEFNPFHYGELLIYPNMGEPVVKATYKQLPFFFSVYLPKGTTTAPNVAIELWQGGRALAQIPAQLPAANESGRIQYAGALPLESIPAGSYELKVILKSGSGSLTRSAHFTIE
jgi:VWFA-related protein